MSQEIHENDIGTVFEITLKDDGVIVDISGTATKAIILRQPDGTATSYSAEFKTDGTDGILTYTSTSAILTPPGIWHLQAAVTWAGPTQEWKSDIYEFRVYENLL